MNTLSKLELSSIDFGLSSPEEVKKNSIARIYTSKLSGEGSVYDERMGPMENNIKCVTCSLDCRDCAGHFGHIELVEPTMHPMFHRIIASFLKCFCFSCHRLIISEDHIKLLGMNKFTKEARFNKILDKIEKSDCCFHCQYPKSKIVYSSTDGIIFMCHNNIKVALEEEEIKKIFYGVVNEDVILLGFDPNISHPRNLIIVNLPVIPPRSRPYIITDGVTCDDDLTIQYLEIIKANNHLEEENLNDTKKQKYIQTLKFRIKTLMNNSQSRARHSNGRALKALKERITGKEGQIRSNLLGKRTNMSGRTVIGPEPTVRADEVVIPESIAKNLTIPERVTSLNIGYLSKLVNDDKANYVIRNGNRINLQFAMCRRQTDISHGDVIIRNGQYLYPSTQKSIDLRKGDKILRDSNIIPIDISLKKEFALQVGDTVERQMKNGDLVLFNRQPSLHKNNMIAKRVIIRPGKTFRFNLSSTKQLNADYDGDECNIFVPSDYDARCELEMLATEKNCLVSPQSSKTNLCIVQDSLLGAYLMTIDSTKIPKELFYNICMCNRDWTPDFILNKIQHIRRVHQELNLPVVAFNGKGLFSLMFPEDLFYTKKNKAHPTEPEVRIYKGVMVSGAMSKTILGSAHNSLLQILCKEYNPDTCMKFIDHVQWVTTEWLMHYGFSIGMGDCIATKTTEINDYVTKCLLEAKQIGDTTQHSKIKEARIKNTLSKSKDVGMKIAKEAMAPDNGFVATVTSGSKGDFFNIAQISGLLGQQNICGSRVQAVFNKGKRTLPHYDYNLGIDQEFESKGFIKSSFIKGLNPKEFFFHAMSGREGVSDSSLKTANTGYIHRKMVKVLEDVSVRYDGTVRNASNHIIQWAYGEDGLDRSQTVVLNDKTELCDIARMAEKINHKYA
jgi:DNA-directed RNA polymerase beta' subunit